MRDYSNEFAHAIQANGGDLVVDVNKYPEDKGARGFSIPRYSLMIWSYGRGYHMDICEWMDINGYPTYFVNKDDSNESVIPQINKALETVNDSIRKSIDEERSKKRMERMNPLAEAYVPMAERT